MRVWDVAVNIIALWVGMDMHLDMSARMRENSMVVVCCDGVMAVSGFVQQLRRSVTFLREKVREEMM